jgi:CIC family chloride channel protein
MIVAGPTLGGVVVGIIVSRFLPSRRTGGVADVIEARALAGRRLSLREGIMSAIATAFSLGAGASAGREGPVIHLGATLAKRRGQRLSLPDYVAAHADRSRRCLGDFGQLQRAHCRRAVCP